MNFAPDTVRGVPWDKALQPIFDAKCTSCHNGVAGAANPTYTVTDNMTMMPMTFTFDLTSKVIQNAQIGERMYSFPASYITLAGPSMMGTQGQDITTTGAFKVYLEFGSARNSFLIQKLNPIKRYPTVDPNAHAFTTPVHPADVGHPEWVLSPDEYYLFELMADNGGQFYSRENATERY
jgi:hypothetical protein